MRKHNSLGQFLLSDGSLKDKLLSRIDIVDGPLDSCCRIWRGAIASNGYGHFNFHRKYYSTHRASWIVYNGDISDGMCVLHKCDVKACVNPSHLFLGTDKDNYDDMVEKGRSPSRFACEGTKLNERTAAVIRALAVKGVYSQSKIGNMFDVVQSVVGNIKAGRRWAHVEPATDAEIAASLAELQAREVEASLRALDQPPTLDNPPAPSARDASSPSVETGVGGSLSDSKPTVRRL